AAPARGVPSAAARPAPARGGARPATALDGAPRPRHRVLAQGRRAAALCGGGRLVAGSTMYGRNATRIQRYFPGYRSPKVAYQELLEEDVQGHTVGLAPGCGRRLCADDTLNRELPRRARLVVGCDRDPHLSRHTSIQRLVICDASALPFRSGLFNLVTAS